MLEWTLMISPCLEERCFVCKGKQDGSVHRDDYNDWFVKVVSMQSCL